MQAQIAQRRPGDRVSLTVYRDGGPIDVSIQLDEAPINSSPASVSERTIHSEERLGINVEELDQELAAELRFPEAGGVVLTQVTRGSPAQRRGVGQYVGNKLIRVNAADIATPEDVRDALDVVEGGEIVSLHFENRDGTGRVVNVRMPS